MRATLHTPRTTKRNITAVTLGAIALIGSLLAAVPAHALSDTGTGGVFTSASGTLLDTRDGTGGYSTPMPAGSFRTIQVAGVAGLPDDGSIGAVTLGVTTAGPAGQGQAVFRPNLDTPSTLGMIYAASGSTTNTVTVAVDAGGTIKVATTTSTGLLLQLQGFYTSGDDGTAPGGFVPVPGKNLVDTRSGVGAPKASIAAGGSITVQVAGQAGIPANASGVVANFIAINDTATAGYVVPYAAGTTRPQRGLNYAPSVKTSNTAQIGLSSDGKITIQNNKTPINLAIDIQGYFTANGNGGSVFTPAAGRLLDTRDQGQSTVGANQTRVINVAGQAGVPVMGSGITAVALTLTSIHTQPTAGRAIMWADGATMPTTSAITYANSSILSNTVIVPIGANGKIDLYNYGDPTNYVLDLQGWYADPTAPTITCGAPYSAGSWNTAIPESITCTVVAPPATASGQYLTVDSPQGTETTELATGAAVTRTATFAPSGGENDLYAAVTDQNGNAVVESDYAFGLGNWSAQPLSLSPSDGNSSALPLSLSALPGAQSAFLDDEAAVYTVSANEDMSEPIWISAATQDEALVPNDLLANGQTYYWTAQVTGTTSWDSAVSTVTTDPQAVTIDLSVDDPEVTLDEGFTTMGNTAIPFPSYKVVNKTLISKYHVDYSRPLGACRAQKGSKCHFTADKTVSVTIGTAFSATKGQIASSLNIDASASQHYGMYIESPKLTSYNKVNVCGAMGYYWKYKVVRHTVSPSPKKPKDSTSGWRYAFRPSYNQYGCHWENA